MTPRLVRFTSTAQEHVRREKDWWLEVAGLRRMYLRKTACHIYYTFDEHDVIVRALWGAKRGRGPAIEP